MDAGLGGAQAAAAITACGGLHRVEFEPIDLDIANGWKRREVAVGDRIRERLQSGANRKWRGRCRKLRSPCAKQKLRLQVSEFRLLPHLGQDTADTR